jgi:hypothetical protein
MRVLSFVCALLIAASCASAANDVRVFIAARSSLIPVSGRVVIDVYWLNHTQRPTAIPTMESYTLSREIVSRSGKRMPRFLGGTQTTGHPSEDRPIPPRTVRRDEIVTQIDATADDFVLVTAEFWGKRHGRFKSNTIVPTKAR